MDKLFHHVTRKNALREAWQRVKQNGLASSLPETRSQITHFDQAAERNISRIQRLLVDDKFEFDPQKGVLKQKASGQGKRGIVMASVHNRIVERALLDCLQEKCGLVKQVIEQSTSVGGVPHRSVPHGLAEINKAFESGKKWFVRSDISGFFDGVPRADILAKLGQHIEDERFLALLGRATEVVLANEKALGEDRKCFPKDDIGVAQGSPLSPLFGNILLWEFDKRFNDRGIICVRFIDDFVLLGEAEGNVRNAFASARSHLADMGLTCHDPYAANANKDKAQSGHIDSGFDFLGYHILPGLYQPSLKARKKLLADVDLHIRLGKRGIKDCIRKEDSFANRQRYAQTQAAIDRMVKGWGNAFAYSTSRSSTMADLDKKIDEKLDYFRQWFTRQIKSLDPNQKRRAGGVCLLRDVETKSLNELPFVISCKQKRFKQSSKTLTVSTDGSVIISGKRRGRDKGPGGWAYLVHETKVTGFGACPDATNNQMELLAVLEVLRRLPKDRSLMIRTDSQYVEQTYNKSLIINSNHGMWTEFSKAVAERSAGIRIIWIKGHAGDEHNEAVDKLAKEAAKQLERQLPQPANLAA